MLDLKSGLAELVQLGTTSASQAEGRGFKSRTPHLILTKNGCNGVNDNNSHLYILKFRGIVFYFVVSNRIALARSPLASMSALFAAS